MPLDPFEPYLQQADDLFTQGDVVKAGQIWQAVLKRVPDHAEAKAGLARVKTFFGVRATQEEARNTLSQPAPAPQPSSTTLLDQGTALYDGGQVEEALQVWERLLDQDPHHVLARGYTNMARSLLGLPLREMPPEPPAPPPVAERPSRDTAPRVGGSTLAIGGSTTDSAPMPPPERPPEPEDDETLLRNGCLLFDMGQPEDALLRWERILQRNPSHPQARDYVNQVRKQLGQPLLEALTSESPTTHAIPEASSAHQEEHEDRLERLVRDGVHLFDMGMSEEAIEKWEVVLQERPDHPDALGYIAMARREPISPTGAGAPPPPPPPAPAPVPPPPPVEVLPPTRAELRRDIQNALDQADRLLQLQRFDEALQLYGRVLEADPAQPSALHGYQMARTLAQASPEPPAPQAIPEPEPDPVDAPAVAIPATAVATRQAEPRSGLELPEALRRLQLPPWALAPKFWAMVVGILTVTIVITTLVNGHIRDTKLKVEVEAAKKEAMAQALRATQVPDLTESVEALVKDAEAQMQASPLLGYLRAQAVMSLQPDHPAGPALLERGRTLLSSSPTPTGGLSEVDSLAKAGDLEAAHALLLSLLRQAPDDADLRARTFRLTGRLVQQNALQEHWGPAREGLVLMRALYPSDRSPSLRIRLLDGIQGMPKTERRYWIPLLG